MQPNAGMEGVVVAELVKRGAQTSAKPQATFLGYRFKGFGQFEAMIEMQNGNIRYTPRDVCEAVARPGNANAYAHEASKEALKYWPTETL